MNKAVFLIGIPGSGKNFILENVLNNYNLLEFTLEQVYSALTSKLSKSDRKNAILQKESIVISTNSTQYIKIRDVKETLEEFGYDTSMIFVDANKSVLFERLKERENFDDVVFERKVAKAKRNKTKLKKVFEYYLEYDNSYSKQNLDVVNLFVDDFINNSFCKLMEYKKIKRKNFSIKNKLVGSLGDRILGISSKASADNISPEYSVRNSGAGFPSTVGPFYNESYASDPSVNLSAFSSLERSTPSTEYYTNANSEPTKNFKNKLTTIKKVVREKTNVTKT